ncbi:MAG: hypothetical protein QOJ52_4027 [Acidimicrobiaceae bacterium]|nr:hypothetical protein [Acidimicrobiaceae bacterium]
MILSLAARRKGIARCAALHLDCARSAQRWCVSVALEEQLLRYRTAIRAPSARERNAAQLLRLNHGWPSSAPPVRLTIDQHYIMSACFDPPRRAKQRRTGALLHEIEIDAGAQFDEPESVRRDLDHGEIGVDAVHDGQSR